jgi:hypothetical protein
MIRMAGRWMGMSCWQPHGRNAERKRQLSKKSRKYRASEEAVTTELREILPPQLREGTTRDVHGNGESSSTCIPIAHALTYTV